jgi:hypothetical protein
MRTLKLGNIELMPIEREFSSYKEFLDWCDGLSDGWKKSNYKASKYIMSLGKLHIFENIKNNYSVSLVSEIVLQVDDDFGFSRDGLSVLIDDPIEIVKFLNGEDAAGIDKDSEGVVINKRDSDIIEWNAETSISFITRWI